MSPPPRRRRAAVIAVTVAAVVSMAGPAAQADPSGSRTDAVVNPQVVANLQANGTTSFMVYLKDRADLSGASSIKNSGERATYVYSQLVDTATKSQAELRIALDSIKAQYQAYWIANAIWVTGDQAVLDAVTAKAGVERVDPVKTYQLIAPTRAAATSGAGIAAVEWGLANIEAPRVWDTFGVRGENIVVANIDTGVDFDHPAVVQQYRGNLGNGSFDHNYNWFDPSDICPTAAPCDNNDHGTHTMGTMVGDDGAGNQIGVAPRAKWIAAKGCEATTPQGECTENALLSSAQWVLAPTDLSGNNPRPDLHADVVNNSWGGGGGDLWYEQSVNAWLAAGMFPSFANGNAGPACGSAASPGDYTQSYATGAYDINNTIAGFSARGPSAVNGGLKPNIAAPGVNVRSSVDGGGYANFNGTSMATPHVSGTVALMWSQAPSLKGNIDATRALLDGTATDVNATECGGTAADNNVFGEGRLNAFRAVTGTLPKIVGTVTNATNGSPIAGATVSSEGIEVTTAADGTYELPAEPGTHEVTASAFGFAAQTVTVVVSGTTTQNFALSPLPLVTLSGRVTDGSGKQWNLYARITIVGRSGPPIFTDPQSGRYTVQVPANGTYRLTTRAEYPGYLTVTQDVVVGATDKTHNISVPVDISACVARSYAPGFSAPVFSESFDTTDTPAGWSVVNRTPSGGWEFDDPGARGNLTGGSGSFAIIDSDELGSGNTQNTDLITPTLDMSALAAPYIRFNSDYRAFSNSTADVDVSIDGGTTWTTVWHQTTVSRRGPTVETIALPQAAGQANVRIRFHYIGTFAWWWEVDNVTIVNRTCTPLPGGLVVGVVTDRNTGAGLVGATVTSDSAPAESAVTVATPDDPAVNDGFYSLVSTQLGERQFTARKAPYQPFPKTVTVVDNATRTLNFPMRAGRLTVTPTNLNAFVPLGESRSTSVVIRNDGSAPAQVELVERNGNFEILRKQGAQLVMHNVPGGLSKAKAGTPTGAVLGGAPLIDDGWTRIRDLPSSLFDNAAATFEGRVYSIGGQSAATEKMFFGYNPDTDTWTRLPDLPHARNKPQAVFTGGLLYVFGGWSLTGPPEPTVDVYDPATNTWSTLAGVTNPKPRAAAGVALVDGEVLLVGGCIDTACNTSNDLVIFDPAAGAFRTATSYPQLVAWQSCGGIGGKVYCAGGLDDATFRNGYSYDPSTDGWSPIADMPLDLWGSAHASASGLLVLMGGVTNGFTTVTNRSIAYDPATNTWMDLPNAGFARYRGAGACGAFKVAGSSGGSVATPQSEMLGGLDSCDEAVDAPWLSTNPTVFTINPGQSRTVTVTVTATAEAGVLQPGTYTAQLGIRSDTPYPVPAVNVTMNVSPPPTWGKIFGTVLGQPCSGTPFGLPAFIRINQVNSDIGYSVKANNQGVYAIWLPAARYEIIVAKDEWVPQTRRTRVDAGFTNQQDFTLEPFTPCP